LKIYFLGLAALSNALAKYINSLCGNKIEEAFQSHFPIDVPYLAHYPNFLALGFGILVTCNEFKSVTPAIFD
jgi:hypothetical protein